MHLGLLLTTLVPILFITSLANSYQTNGKQQGLVGDKKDKLLVAASGGVPPSFFETEESESGKVEEDSSGGDETVASGDPNTETTLSNSEDVDEDTDMMNSTEEEYYDESTEEVNSHNSNETNQTGESQTENDETEGRDRKTLTTVIDERETVKINKKCDCTFTSQSSFRERRPSWTYTFAISYSSFFPENYTPDFVVNEDMDSYYGETENPLMEVSFGVKKNLQVMALSLVLGAGTYQNSTEGMSTLSLKPVRISGELALDTLCEEPYVVPYAQFGYYYVFFSEEVGTQKLEGTADGLSWTAGLRLQLDWMDQENDYSSYDDLGMENSFLYIEARSQIASGAVSGNDLFDFSSSPQLGGGLSLEF
jgi:hypothetical protein